ncbi:hypothetical protein EOL96_08945 [Candidatus Saccharibacteria bacterium]|nr:hypothetical protein [Candidatus Saccharibacteria bacterium]
MRSKLDKHKLHFESITFKQAKKEGITVTRLSGLQRLQLRLAWIKRGRDIEFEEFVKRVCSAKGIIYTVPVKIQRETVKVVKAEDKAK